jgi:MFS superfamily sulfate permease-like transporter
VAKSKKEFTLDMGSSLVFERVEKLKTEFDKALNKLQPLHILSGNITEIDLTGVQLLHYFNTRAQVNAKNVKFSVKISEEAQLMLAKCGFSNLYNTLSK